MKKIVLGTIIAAASLMAANIAACAGCHGANFEKAALGKSQIVKGWDAAKIETALKGYKDGSYGGAMKGVMKGQVARLSDADIKAIAEQISKL
jgi:cytochrome c553